MSEAPMSEGSAEGCAGAGAVGAQGAAGAGVSGAAEAGPAAGAPLSSMADGARCRVVRVDAGRGLRAHLMAMGLRPGVAVRVVKNGGAGPFVLAMQALRLVLGRGMAHRIHVVREDPDGAEGGGGRE